MVHGLVLILVMVCGAANVARAQHPLFDARGFDPHRSFFSQLPFEHVDPLSGNLLLTFTDLVLPGNAGFDLRIERSYNSKIFRDYQTNPNGGLIEEDSWAGIGWRLHLGRVLLGPTGLGRPVIQMPDGSDHPAFFHEAPLPPGCAPCYITKDYWIYDASDYTLTLPNGRVYTFGHVGPGGRYATRIEDTFGNSVTVTYHSAPQDGIATITQDLGNSQTRTVTFTVNPSTQTLATMSFEGRVWTYTQVSAPSVGHHLLTTVAPPVGPSWTFQYNTTVVPRCELASVTTPQGGQIAYQFAEKTLSMANQLLKFRTLTNRLANGRDLQEGAWLYSYAQGPDQNRSIVSGPSGVTTTHTFFGIGNTHYQPSIGAWKVGLPSSMAISDPSGVLQTQNMAWTPSVGISYEDQGIGFEVDHYIFVPLLESSQIVRGPDTFQTTNSYHSTDWNDYGRPHLVTETGQATRSTQRVFQYSGLTGYIKDKIQSETVTVAGESFTKSFGYRSDGFLLSQSIYGVPSTFAPTSRGDVATVTNARNYSTHLSYSYGTLRDTQTPEYTITRLINSDGTVAWERRRGFTTSYQYDDLQRLTRVTPPTGNPTIVGFDNMGGTFTTSSRGPSSTTTYLDGFGRVSGTVNNVGVRTDVTVDALGRHTYESYPYVSNNIGTTLTYDGLSRVVRRTHPDQTWIGYTYNGIDVTIRDENGRNTQQAWSAFGDPDEKRLTSVTADQQTTTYTYNTVGSLRTVQGFGQARTWVYNTKNQLVSEEHPESGLVTYGRDAVGNMTQRTPQGSQYVIYTYDPNDRLRLVDADLSGTLNDISITYDESDNRRVVVNGTVSTVYDYDSANRLASRTDTIASRTFTTTWTYDENDNPIRVDYPSQRSLIYAYDSENRATSVGETSQTYASQVAYHPSGAIASFLAGNQQTHSTTFNDRYQVYRVTAGSALTLTYGYEDVGNVSSITESTRAGMNQGFTYDALDRLRVANGFWGAGNFEYDIRGNRAVKTIGNQTTTYHYEGTNSNRLSYASGAEAATFDFDNRGNMTLDGGRILTYTPFDMMATATTSGAVTTYRYDSDNLRSLRIGPGGTNYYVHGAGGQLLAEYQENCPGQVSLNRDYIYLGGRLVAAVRPAPSQIVTMSLTAIGASVAEAAGSVTFGVQMTTGNGAALGCTATVQYTTSSGSATSGADFQPASGTMTFPTASGSGAVQNIVVPIVADALNELPEVFSLVLSNPTGGTLGTALRSVTINDDDPQPSLTIGSITFAEGSAGQANVAFTVTLSAPSGRDVSVGYSTADGTASAGVDYVAVSATTSFAQGVTAAPAVVTIVGDTVPEVLKTFTVTLANANGATIASAQATGTILDDDSASGEDLIADFGAIDGIQLREYGGPWGLIHTLPSEQIVAGDLDNNGIDDLVIDFGEFHGVWVRANGGSWFFLQAVSPQFMMAGNVNGTGGDDVVMSFPSPHGIWVFLDGASWLQLHNLTAESIVSGDFDGNGYDELLIDFGLAQGGVWKRSELGAWSQLHGLSPNVMTVADIDGNGVDDAILSFDVPPEQNPGIWAHINGAVWAQLHPLRAERLVAGDLDGSPGDELVISFGLGHGIWTYDLSTAGNAWVQLHVLSAEVMSVGDFDGGGRSDIAIDFGPGHGLWLLMNWSSWVQFWTGNVEGLATGRIQ
jgi:hypothetical protein